jgi:TolB-like protein/DNA-binding winged helix-turn-helix (wHTH) protein
MGSRAMLTPDHAPCASVIRFGIFEVDVRSGELRKNGLRIRLQEQPFQVLVTLLTRPGEVVTREELRERIWPQGTFVCFDYALNTAIKKIRAALSDDANIPRYIETIPRRGYRFVGNVSTVSETGVAPVAVDVLSTMQSGSAQASRSRVPVAGLAVLVLLAAGGLYLVQRAGSRRAFPPKRAMVVVLPFENLDASPGQNAFCAGLTEEVITQLGRIDPENIGVAARSTVIAYEGNHMSAAEIGKKLRAAYVLEGSVRHDQSRVRVSAQLIRTTDQSHVWANEFDGKLNDGLAFQSDVAAAISQQVRRTLSSSATPGSR